VTARFVWLGRGVDYAEAHATQRRLVDARAAGEIPDTVLLLEHAEVVTVGRARGAAGSAVGAHAPVVEVERGGDATWHGPGQLVAYPIVQLEGRRRDLHHHLRALEDAVVGLLSPMGLGGIRDDRNTGVWLPQASGPPRKVCAVGIACRRWVTWHGLALNVCPDLAGFRSIRPCGFDPDVVTRLCDQLSPHPSLPDLVEPLAQHLASSLGLTYGGVTSEPLSTL
jgi:lipoyl(octanoyl) transferase